MKRLLIMAFTFLNSLGIFATDYDGMWKNVNSVLEKDLPKDGMTLLKKIAKTAEKEKEYGELLAAELYYARVEAEVTPDSLTPAINRLKQKALETEGKDAVLCAVYNAILAKICNLAKLPDDAKTEVLTPDQYFDRALRNPDLLANTKTDAYKRLIEHEMNDGVFNNDLLSIIGHEAKRYEFLKQYYASHGNRVAALVEHLQMVRLGDFGNDDMAITSKKNMLNAGMEEFADMPESAVFAHDFYKLLESDTDISEQTRYEYLNNSIAHYKELGDAHGVDKYYNVLRNDLIELTNPRFSISLDNDISITNIRNVKELNIEFIEIDADGRQTFRLHEEKDIKKVMSMAKGPRQTVKLNYDRPEWETHSDNVPLPDMPYGVYLVNASAGKATSKTMFYHTDLTLLHIGTGERKTMRMVVVSKKTGAPVPNAELVLTDEYYDKVVKTMHAQTDAKGEARLTDILDYDYVWVSTSGKNGTVKDRAFRKTWFSSSFGDQTYTHRQDIANVITDRSIYRPGQVIKGTVIVHNSKDIDNIHVQPGLSLTVNLLDPDGKTVSTQSVKTNAMGNAAFTFDVPKEGKNGEYYIYLPLFDSATNTRIRVEEYKRPTFEVKVFEPEKYAEPILVDPNATQNSLDVQFMVNTYSQIPVADAEVTYSVKRERNWVWWRYYHEDNSSEVRSIINDAKTTTSRNGIIRLSLPLTLPEKSNSTYRFTVNVKVTDKSGETHECVLYFNAKHNASQSANQPEEIEQKPDFTLSRNSFPSDGSAVTLSVHNDNPTKTYLYYMVYAGKTIVEDSTVIFSKDYKRSFTYKPEYGEALSIFYAWVMDGKLHAYSTSILKPQPNLNLPVKWITFRDRTQPGSEETWTLKVGNNNSNGIAALTATIFDKSLDAIYPHNIFLNTILNSYSHYANWSWHQSPSTQFSLTDRQHTLSSKSVWYLGRFNERYLPYRSYYSRYMGGGSRNRVKARDEMMLMDMAMPMVEAKEASLAKGNSVAKVKANEEQQPPAPADLSSLVRTNLQETAFFAPSILSDDEGNINLTFKLPETMTTWRLHGLVHDKQMRYAIIDTTCVAQKDIVVKPNVPRFLRQNDEAVMAATISNTTEDALATDVIMQLLIPETNAVVWEHRQKVNIPGKVTTAVAFPVPAIQTDTLLVYRIAATSTTGSSDGEQHYIPVLPATELLTTSLAITQHTPGTYVKDISDLFFDGATERTLKISYAPHAVQMIVDAIPSVTHPNRKDALSLASAIYVGSLFSKEDSLCKKMTSELMELQLSSGAWPWWAGMRASVWTTASISRLFARLEYQGLLPEPCRKMLTKSLPYLSSFIKDEAAELRKLQKKYPKRQFHPSELSTDILYILALSNHSGNKAAASMLQKHKKDINYMLNLIEKVPAEMTIYGKAHAAALLAYYGRTKTALEQIESMKQYSVCTEEAGRYYDSPNAYYSWRNYRIPTEVAAIEALRIVTPEDTTTIEEMKRWLLHEKRTQQWDSSINTADAIYAFILGDSTVFDSHEGENWGNITFCGKEITNNTTINIQDYEITPGNAKVEISKLTPGTSWGAILANQRAPLSSLRDTGSGFSIRREILSPSHTSPSYISPSHISPSYKEGAGGRSGGSWGSWSVGTRITIRITIDADRDYDFVEVCDHRAACLEPVEQLSGYCSAITGGTARGSYSGYYRVTHDNNTEYFFDHLAKGTHVIETDYYVDRNGTYMQGTCTVKCTYAPEFRAMQAPEKLVIGD